MDSMEKAEATAKYRSRIIAMYQRYAPEKPLSHVDFLMAKYRDYEAEVLETLKEKYGPEPALAAVDYKTRVVELLKDSGVSQQDAVTLLEQHNGMEEALLHSLVGRFGAERLKDQSEAVGAGQSNLSVLDAMNMTAEDRDSALQQRKQQFINDMSLASVESAQVATRQVMQEVGRTRNVLEEQQREIRQLRLDIAASNSQSSATSLDVEAECKKISRDLTRVKMELMVLERERDPNMVSKVELDVVESQIDTVNMQLAQTTDLYESYEMVLRKHLALYSKTPVRQALRKLDPALCATLDIV